MFRFFANGGLEVGFGKHFCVIVVELNGLCELGGGHRNR